MTNENDTNPRKRLPDLRRGRTAVIAGILVAFGAGIGATALAQRERAVTMVALTPAPISTMKDWTPVAIQGQVAEVFGNKFVVSDDSGRALVETGRAGEDKPLVAKDEKVTVQGRFEHGFVHAMAVQHADGRNEVLSPPPPPPRPDHDGPRGPMQAPPPPPPSAN